jgi:TolA-binding protein
MKRQGKWVALVVLAALAGCAYFNTLYNAKERYKEADKMRRGRDGKVTRQQQDAYDEVIEKCQIMIGTYPKSRHVDDAMLLIARSLHAQDRFAEAAAQCDSLAVKFPDSGLLPEARFLKGRSLAEWGEYEAAIAALNAYAEQYPKHKRRPYAFYFLATSAMSLDREEEALGYVEEMQERYPKDAHTFNAQIEVARILSEQGMHGRAIGVYEALDSRRLPESSRYQVWMGMGQAYVETGAYAEALAVVARLEELVLKPQEKPPVRLLQARAQMGAGDRDGAIATYARVIKQFTRGEHVSEAGFRLGEIYEEMDSLAVAKTYFEGVPAAYAHSPFARDAIKRAGNIDKLLRLQEAADSPEAQALRLFSMAELQMFQFENPDKALEAYQQLLDTYPESEYAPRAAYAVGYIHAVVRQDTLAARAACDLLQSRYPETQQAAYVYLLLGGDPVRGGVLPAPAPPAEGEAAPPETDEAPPETPREEGEAPPEESEEDEAPPEESEE